MSQQSPPESFDDAYVVGKGKKALKLKGAFGSTKMLLLGKATVRFMHPHTSLTHTRYNSWTILTTFFLRDMILSQNYITPL